MVEPTAKGGIYSLAGEFFDYMAQTEGRKAVGCMVQIRQKYNWK